MRTTLKQSLLSALLMYSSISVADNIIDINSKLPSQGSGSAAVSGLKIEDKNVSFEKKSNYAIFEGDIILGDLSDAQLSPLSNSSKSIAITGLGYRWINNTLPFRFDGTVDTYTRSLVYSAIEHIEANTNIKFVERTVLNARQYPDYVEVTSQDNACWSYVGRRGGRQTLNVYWACGFGATVHEFGHALGLWHEQSREDRDQYVQITFENIEEDKRHNFDQHILDGDDIGFYDYNSIMHYGPKAFSNNGLETITPLQSGVRIGQRAGLSDGDIAAINELYPEVITFKSKTRYISNLWGSAGLTRAGDFNGDGRADIVSMNGSTAYLKLSNGDGFDSESVYVSNQWGNSAFTFAGDFNGDGLDDIASIHSGLAYMKLSTGRGFRSEVWQISNLWGSASTTVVGDFNGDGIMDIASARGSSVFMKFSTGSGFTNTRWTTNATWGNGAFTYAGDFNGDGLADFASMHNGIAYMKINNGSGFTHQQWDISAYWGHASFTFAADFNGDGVTDIASASGSNIYIKYSTGQGFQNAILSVLNEWGNGSFTYAADFDGNGRADITSIHGSRAYMKMN